MSTEVMQQTLEALEYHQAQTRPIEKTANAIAALRSELARPAAPAPAPAPKDAADYVIEAAIDVLVRERDDLDRRCTEYMEAGNQQALRITELEAQLAAQPAMTGEQKRDMLIGRAINRAAEELPEGYEISIDIERGAGIVELWDGEGDSRIIDSGEPFYAQINEAIDSAINAAAQGAKEGGE